MSASFLREAADSDDRWVDRPLFASDADVTVYWPDVRPCYEERLLAVAAAVLGRPAPESGE